MSDAVVDLVDTRFVLPPDAVVLAVDELSERLRLRIGLVEEGCSVVTRPGNRIAAQLVAGPLAQLLREFDEPHRLTDGVLSFSRRRGEDPTAILDVAFDALSTLVESRVLVAQDAPDATGATPSFGAGQVVGGWEIERLIRSLDDSEVYRARGEDGTRVALKVARDERPAMSSVLSHEAAVLDDVGGYDTPHLVQDGSREARPFIAIEWVWGVSIGIVAHQARAAGDRWRLHELVHAMLEAYARLHQRGVLHGDVHPGNCLVDDAGRVVLLDFGNARRIDATNPIDLGRSGVAHFHDPQFAEALLAGHPQPAATPASEQYAIGILAYLLLSGVHPIDAPGITTQLLERIVSRTPRPFTARAVAAWPAVERVLGRALAREPEDRHADVSAMATAFAQVPPTDLVAGLSAAHARRGWSQAVRQVRDHQLTQALEPENWHAPPRQSAWFALRAAMTEGDARLLAVADVHARRLGASWVDHFVAAHVARARGDAASHAAAIAGGVEALGEAPTNVGHALAGAASLLRHGATPGVDNGPLVRWADAEVERLIFTFGEGGAAAADPTVIAGVMAMAASGTIAVPTGLDPWLRRWAEVRNGDVWLWAWAHDVFADQGSRTSAVTAPRSRSPLAGALEALRLHQITGDVGFVEQARTLVESAQRAGAAALAIALLVVEAEVPERMVPPPFSITC